MNRIKILVACEESQVVTKAFRERGFEAYSCDLQPCSGGHPEWHIKGDVFEVLYKDWDLLIGHPPCTYLSYAGTAWWNQPGRVFKRIEALEFFAKLWEAPIEHICLENPRGCASPVIAKYSQIINPYYFGDEYTKPTWLWLKNLPHLKHYKTTDLFSQRSHATSKGEFVEHVNKNGVKKKDSKWFYEAVSLPPDERSRLRSKTFPGIAAAMANQWGNYLINLKTKVA